MRNESRRRIATTSSLSATDALMPIDDASIKRRSTADADGSPESLFGDRMVDVGTVRATAAAPDRSRLTRIAERAHQIYEARGGQHGRSLDDWLQAEREIDGQA